MNQEAIKKFGPLAAARKSSLLSQKQMANKLGITLPTMAKIEKNPEYVNLNDLGIIYQAVGVDGKAIIEQFVNNFFIS